MVAVSSANTSSLCQFLNAAPKEKMGALTHMSIVFAFGTSGQNEWVSFMDFPTARTTIFAVVLLSYRVPVV